MRLVLVIVGVLMLVGGLYFALGSDAGSAPVEPVGVAPVSAPDRPLPEDVTLEDVGESQRVVNERENLAISVENAEVPSALASLMIAVTIEGKVLPPAVNVECRDALARWIPLQSDESHSLWTNAAVVPGDASVSVVAAGFVSVVHDFTLRAIPGVQRIDVRLERAPTVHVRWRCDDGRPILDALAGPGVLASAVLLRVGQDECRRQPGDDAPSSVCSAIFEVKPGAKSATRTSAWPDAPPDALCSITLTTGLPAVVTAWIDGTVVDSVQVEDAAQDVVFSTRLDILQRLRTNVHYCLVDDATGERVPSARVSGRTRAGVGRTAVDAGPEGCRDDDRFTPGRWLLSFEAPGRATIVREVELVSGARMELGELRFLAPASVVVRVLDEGGRPASSVRVGLVPQDAWEWGLRIDISTDPDGRARFRDLAPGPHTLFVGDARYACTAQVVEARSGDRLTQYDVQLQAGVEVALDFGRQPSVDRRAFLYDEQGELVTTWSLTATGLVAVRLLPGRYVAEVAGQPNAHAVDVGDESVVYDLR